MTSFRPSIKAWFSPSTFLFRQLLESPKITLPHLAKHSLQWSEGPVVSTIETTSAGPSLLEEARVLEDAEVLGNRWPADVEGSGDVAGGALGVPHPQRGLPASLS